MANYKIDITKEHPGIFPEMLFFYAKNFKYLAAANQ